MKATINSKGALKISPENELESYALKKWADNYIVEVCGNGCESVLQIEVIEPQEPPNQ